jgi:UDP-N-acetylglucosamine--N-acetylmuramyl-(pentapeptide) pyrophosphoryl-undecaprenol N-acetylglucosamine transferase
MDLNELLRRHAPAGPLGAGVEIVDVLRDEQDVAGTGGELDDGAVGRPAIFIPFGAATDSHQMRNAEELLRAGAARFISEPELSGERLAREILALIDYPARLVELGTRARAFARPRAAEKIVDLIEEVVRK